MVNKDYHKRYKRKDKTKITQLNITARLQLQYEPFKIIRALV